MNDIFSAAPGIWLGAAVSGYCFGCLDMAWLLAFYRNLDITATGAGSPGAGNAFATMGVKAGIFTAAWDIGKAGMAYAFTRIVLQGPWAACVLAAMASVIGHCFPFWLDFDGGKGFAPFAGFMICFDWRLAAPVLAAGLCAAAASDKIAAMALLCALAWPFVAGLSHGPAWGAACAVLSGLLVWRHRRNILNLAAGTEPGIRDAVRRARAAGAKRSS